MKKVINSKIFAIFITALICISGTVMASVVYSSKLVSYINSDNSEMTVEEALNKLYIENDKINIDESFISWSGVSGTWNNIILNSDGTGKYGANNSGIIFSYTTVGRVVTVKALVDCKVKIYVANSKQYANLTQDFKANDVIRTFDNSEVNHEIISAYMIAIKTK